jgi:hypothetical protein
MEEKIMRKRANRKEGDVKKTKTKLLLPDPSALKTDSETLLNIDG